MDLFCRLKRLVFWWICAEDWCIPYFDCFILRPELSFFLVGLYWQPVCFIFVWIFFGRQGIMSVCLSVKDSWLVYDED